MTIRGIRTAGELLHQLWMACQHLSEQGGDEGSLQRHAAAMALQCGHGMSREQAEHYVQTHGAVRAINDFEEAHSIRFDQTHGYVERAADGGEYAVATYPPSTEQAQEYQPQEGPLESEWEANSQVAFPSGAYYARRKLERDLQLSREMVRADALRGQPDHTELEPYAGNVGRPHVPSWGEREPERPLSGIEARQEALRLEMEELDSRVAAMDESEIEDALNENSGFEVDIS